MSNVDVEALPIEGAWKLTPRQFTDERGLFLEWFRQDAFAETVGHPLHLRQANLSVSAAGVVRGIHFAEVPPSQAKYVTCMHGAVLDVVVDIRVGSPTFGQWTSVLLDDAERRAVYVAEGLGHAFMSLADGSTVAYLCSTTYQPTQEHAINAFDRQLAITWPAAGRNGRTLQPTVSDKDAAAPSFAQASASGLLPRYSDAVAYYESLRSE